MKCIGYPADCPDAAELMDELGRYEQRLNDAAALQSSLAEVRAQLDDRRAEALIHVCGLRDDKDMPLASNDKLRDAMVQRYLVENEDTLALLGNEASLERDLLLQRARVTAQEQRVKAALAWLRFLSKGSE